MPDTTRTAGRPWDQQEGEPDDAFARFLVYLNIGPGRRLEDAFEQSRTGRPGRGRRTGHGRQKAYMAWVLEAERRHWRERAHAWDMHRLPAMIQESQKMYEALRHAALQKTLESCAPALLQKTLESCARLTTAGGLPK
jgi:hypothetical protein